MAPMKTSSNNNLSSQYGEAVARQANVIASCYVVDPSASLKGFHYCTTLAAGAEWYSGGSYLRTPLPPDKPPPRGHHLGEPAGADPQA